MPRARQSSWFGKTRFWQVASEILERVVQTQGEAIHRAARIFADAIDRGGVVHAYGTGHSKAFAMELANRAGGLVPMNRLDTVDLILAGWPAEEVLRPGLRVGPRGWAGARLAATRSSRTTPSSSPRIQA